MYITLKSAFIMLRQRITQNILIGLIIMMISSLLYIGISIVSQAAPFQEMFHRANAAENMIVMTKIDDEVQRAAAWYENRNEVDQVLIYETDMVNVEYENKNKNITEMIFLTQYLDSNVDILYTDANTIAKAPERNQIMVSHSFAKGRNLEIGDIIKYKYNGQEFALTISSIVVDPQFSTVFMTPSRCFVASDFFEVNNITNSMENLSVKFHDIENTDDIAIYTEFTQTQTDISSPLFIDYKTIENSYNIVMGIIAAILIAVSILIFIIVVFVIKSTLQNQILNQYKQIGVKKAIGYTNIQIRNSMFFVYGMIGIVSSVLGVVIGLPIRRIINAGIAADIQVGIDVSADIFMLITVLLVFSIILIFSWISTGKATEVKPVQAIKYGMPERKVGNNKFSIVTSKNKPLSWLLATKQSFANKRKTVTTIVLVTLLVYVALLIGNMGDTLASSKYLASYLFGMNVGDAAVSLEQGEDVEEAYHRILSVDEVQECVVVSINLGSSYTAADGFSKPIGESLIYGDLPDDFMILKQGRQPDNEHEIVISSDVADNAGRTVGDYISIKDKQSDSSYLITGIYDSVMTNMNSYVRFDKKIPQNMKSDSEYYWIYTETGVADIEKTDSEIKALLGANAKVTEFDSNVKNVVSSVEDFPMVVNLLLIVFLIVSGIIVFNTTIIDIKNSTKVYGILKAVGFSNSFIVRVLLIRVMVVSVISVVLGFILNMLTMNVLMDAVFAITPFSSINMPVLFSGTKTGILVVLFILVSVISALVPSGKISRVSPKQLISE